MQNENFEFIFNEAPIVFKENISRKSSLIHNEAISCAQRYLVAEAELLEVIIEIDKERIYEEFGLTHLTPYCVKHLGLSEDVAANFVRVARKSQQVPELKTAIEDGRLSVTKAKAIASVITAENHKVWIDKAQCLSKDKLEKDVAQTSPQSRKPEKAKVSGPNTVRVEFELTEEEMRLFRRVQDLVSQKLKKSATLAETQNELVKLYLEQRDPVKKAERAGKRSSAKKSQTAEKQESAERQVPGPFDGAIAEHGQGREALKAKVVHAANLRDKGLCQAVQPDGSICGQSRWVHFHHIQPVANGGENTAENLVTLCSSHHRLWHSQPRND
jgi:hypothetical protein